MLTGEKKMAVIGICGDNCAYCPRYLATLSGKTEELEKVKELWVRLGLRDPSLPAWGLVCHGCAPANNCAYSELRACVYGKGVESCGLCETYPCALVDAAFQRSDELFSQTMLVCTPEEVELFRKAFFSKRQNLEKRHFEKHRKNKP
jgi:hypothetical protein